MSTSKTGTASIAESLLAEFDASGENAAGFARSRGIAAWRIYYALNRRAGKQRHRRATARPAGPTLLPVRVVPDAPKPAAAVLEIELASGHRLRVGADFDPVLLRRVLGALERC